MPVLLLSAIHFESPPFLSFGLQPTAYSLLLAAIDFATPLFLLGVLAAAIPVVIHMLQRQQAPEMPFSTLRFLKLSVEKTARKRRLTDLWLLLFRMSILALLALALAGPLLRGANKLFGNRAAAVAIVLDNSPSMSLADGGEVRFERARNLTLQVLDQLRDGDEVALLLTGGPSLQQETTYRRLENVQRLTEEARICLARADLPASLERARHLLSTSNAPNKELYLVTDLQKSGWRSQAETTADDGTSDEDSIPLVVIDIHKERPNNVSLETVECRATVPAVGLPVQIIGTVRNGGLAEQEVQVQLTIDDQIIEQSEPILLGAGETHAVKFVYVPQKAGIHDGRLVLVDNDASSLDNQRSFVLDTQSPVQVALVDQRTGDEAPHRSASYYLERALHPVSQVLYAMEVTRLKPELLNEEPLGAFSSVLCVDLPPPDEASLNALEEYVAAGGTLFWVCGPNNDPDQMQSSPLYPGPFSFPADDDRAGWHWAFLEEAHPALRPLTKPADLYLSISVDRYLKLELPKDTTARILARLDSGDPALVSHPVGSGTVYTLTTGAHAQWTTLPLKPIFVPLINRLILYSAERERGPLEVSPGNPAIFRFAEEPEPITIEITPPGNAERSRLTSSTVEKHQEFQYTETYAAGVYRLRMVEARKPRQFAFAVNPDPTEADPESLSQAELESRLGGPVITATDEATLADTVQRLHEGSPMMDWFLILVLIGGVLEVLIANRAGKQKPLAAEDHASNDIQAILRRAQTIHQLEDYRRPAG